MKRKITFTVKCPIVFSIPEDFNQERLRDLWKELRTFGDSLSSSEGSGFIVLPEKVKFNDVKEALVDAKIKKLMKRK